MSCASRKENRAARHRRVRRKIHGSADRPRMAIMISGRYMYVQFIDDDKGVTLAAASTQGAESKNNMATAKGLGRKVAEMALAKGIKNTVIDRGGFKFHGRVKAIVDAAREAGVASGKREEK